MILGVILSTLHQSSLGHRVPDHADKLHPFWYTPLLPVFFFLSAIAVGLAMTIFESSMSSKYFGRAAGVADPAGTGTRAGGRARACTAFCGLRTCCIAASCGLILCRATSSISSCWKSLLRLCRCSAVHSEDQTNTAQGLYLAAVLVVLGFITNRLNVSITGMETRGLTTSRSGRKS